MISRKNPDTMYDKTPAPLFMKKFKHSLGSICEEVERAGMNIPLDFYISNCHQDQQIEKKKSMKANIYR